MHAGLIEFCGPGVVWLAAHARVMSTACSLGGCPVDKTPPSDTPYSEFGDFLERSNPDYKGRQTCAEHCFSEVR